MKILFIAHRGGPATKELTGQEVKDQPWVATFLERLNSDQANFQIGHCFQTSRKDLKKTEIDGITYYPFTVENSKISRWLNRIFVRIPKPEAFSTIQSAVEDFRPDFIHVFGTENPYGLLEYKKNIPVIVQIQGLLNTIFPVYSGSVSKKEVFLSAGVLNFLKGGYFFDYLRMKKSADNENLILKKVRHVIGTTQFDESYLRSLNLVTSYDKLNLILRRQFYHESWEVNDSSEIVTISNEYTYKGIEVIIRTAKLLVEMNIKFKWKIIGVSSNSFFIGVYKKIFFESPSWECLEYLGVKEPESMIEVLKRCRLYVNPSNIENAPLSLCEAMMVGMPVITSDAGGAKHLVCDGIDGLIFKSGDHNQLAARIIELLNDRELAVTLGKNARQTALLRHDPSEIIRQYKEIINKFIEK